MQAVWDRSGEVYLSLTLRQSRQGIATIFPEDGSIKPWQQWDGLKQQIETLEASIEFFSSYSARTSSCSIYIFEKGRHGCWLAQSSDIPILRDALYKRGESKLYQEFRSHQSTRFSFGLVALAVDLLASAIGIFWILWGEIFIGEVVEVGALIPNACSISATCESVSGFHMAWISG